MTECEIYDELWIAWVDWDRDEVLRSTTTTKMAQELKLHSPVGGESVVLQWPLSDVVTSRRFYRNSRSISALCS